VRFVEGSREAVAEVGLDGRVRIEEAPMQEIPLPDASVDLVLP
jgi:hypothetical protein